MRCFVALGLALLFAAPAEAEIVARSDSGFVIRQVAEVTATPAQAWQELIQPAAWWNPEHTFSSNAGNLSLEPRAGGCLCEVLPGEDGASAPRGGVEHMRVVLVDQAKALRLSGALGPLQSEAVAATLTITLKPIDGGTRLTWEYVVGGFMRYKQEQIAPAVDKIISEQLTRLAEKLGPKAPAANPKPQPGMESGR
jgi:hypothetical protein